MYRKIPVEYDTNDDLKSKYPSDTKSRIYVLTKNFTYEYRRKLASSYKRRKLVGGYKSKSPTDFAPSFNNRSSVVSYIDRKSE